MFVKERQLRQALSKGGFHSHVKGIMKTDKLRGSCQKVGCKTFSYKGPGGQGEKFVESGIQVPRDHCRF